MTAAQGARETQGLSRQALVGGAMILLGVALFFPQHQDWNVPWHRSRWTLILMFMGTIRLINPGVHVESDGTAAAQARSTRRGELK